MKYQQKKTLEEVVFILGINRVQENGTQNDVDSSYKLPKEKT